MTARAAYVTEEYPRAAAASNGGIKSEMQTNRCVHLLQRMIIIFLLLLSHTPGQFSAWTKGILIVRNAHDSPRIIAQRSSHQPDLVTRRERAPNQHTRRIYFPRPRQPRLLGLFVTQLLTRGLRARTDIQDAALKLNSWIS
jgi:hypothetical protein